jgi:hypothetical protein
MTMFIQQIVRAPCFAWLLIAIAFAGGLPSSVAWAQFEDVGEEEEAGQNRGRRGHFQIDENQFDQWVYGGSGNARQHRARLDSMVSLQLERYDRICHLSSKQKDLLRLAAQGDIKRLEESVQVARKKFNVARFDQQKFQQVWQDIQPLRNKIQNGIFDETSLLRKVVRGVLDQEQIAKYEQTDLERRKFIYQAKIGLSVAQLQNSVPMRDEQRRRFETLLFEQTEVPKKYGQYAYNLVMIHASKLPEEEMKAIFDEAQWRALKQTFDQCRGMERHLERQGLLQ